MIIFIKKISLTKIAEFFGISHSYILKISFLTAESSDDFYNFGYYNEIWCG